MGRNFSLDDFCENCVSHLKTNDAKNNEHREENYYATGNGRYNCPLGNVTRVLHKFVINPGATPDSDQKSYKPFTHKLMISETGGEGEIRTLDTVSRILLFESSAFNHSATSPPS
jgi:hypothetical protein